MTTLTAARRSQVPTAAVSGAAAAAVAALGTVLLPLGLTAAYIGVTTTTAGILAVAAAAIDARTRRLPNAVVAPIGAIALLQAVALSASRGDPETAVRAVIAAAVLGTLYALMAFAGWVGVGDVKYVAVLGLLLGTFIGIAAIAIAPIAILLASLHRATGALLRRGQPRRLPHGPAILLAAAAVSTFIPLGMV